MKFVIAIVLSILCLNASAQDPVGNLVVQAYASASPFTPDDIVRNGSLYSNFVTLSGTQASIWVGETMYLSNSHPLAFNTIDSSNITWFNSYFLASAPGGTVVGPLGFDLTQIFQTSGGFAFYDQMGSTAIRTDTLGNTIAGNQGNIFALVFQVPTDQLQQLGDQVITGLSVNVNDNGTPGVGDSYGSAAAFVFQSVPEPSTAWQLVAGLAISGCVAWSISYYGNRRSSRL
ncbi:MAG: hypothetical protein PHF79_03270 [Candidatus Pacebacteria bacterium]|nr:hypothetical protein [Candidatus Paceibacterota bacterium]